MKSFNRDLLVLSKKASLDPGELEHEVEQLHQILFFTETMQNFCIANELIDVNRYKIITKPHLIQRLVQEGELKPFQFVCNKN
jgi:hypothetical protein